MTIPAPTSAKSGGGSPRNRANARCGRCGAGVASPPHSLPCACHPTSKESHMTAHRITRRRMLQGTGAALLGAGLFGTAARQASADPAALDPSRAAALTALLAALASGPAPELDTAGYADDFGAYYAEAHAPFRRYVEDGLDELGAEPA